MATCEEGSCFLPELRVCSGVLCARVDMLSGPLIMDRKLPFFSPHFSHLPVNAGSSMALLIISYWGFGVLCIIPRKWTGMRMFREVTFVQCLPNDT